MGRSLRFFWTLFRSCSRRARSLEMSSEFGSESVSRVDWYSTGESEETVEGEESWRRSWSSTWSIGVSSSMMVLDRAGCFTAFVSKRRFGGRPLEGGMPGVRQDSGGWTG